MKDSGLRECWADGQTGSGRLTISCNAISGSGPAIFTHCHLQQRVESLGAGIERAAVEHLM